MSKFIISLLFCLSASADTSHDLTSFMMTPNLKRILWAPVSEGQLQFLQYIIDRAKLSGIEVKHLPPEGFQQFSSDRVNFILGALTNANMDPVRSRVLHQFRLIEIVAIHYGIALEDLAPEQLYQMADHFLEIKDGEFKFTFADPQSLRPEIGLLAYPAAMIEALFSRKGISHERLSNVEVFPALEDEVLAQTNPTDSQTRVLLQSWFFDLRASDYYNKLNDPLFANRLTPNAKRALLLGSAEYREKHKLAVMNAIIADQNAMSKDVALYRTPSNFLLATCQRILNSFRRQ